MTLRNKEITLSQDLWIKDKLNLGNKFYKKEDVKEAVLEDLADIESLYNSINENDNWVDIKAKLKIHIWYKKRRFGNFEK
jgi:hypothetical protein